MRHSVASLALLLTVAGCGSPQSSRSDLEAFDVQEPPAGEAADGIATRTVVPGAPDVSVSAAPGVAFNYDYAFRLEAPRIEGVLEQHAQRCEQLGLARCRITGMRYRLVGEHEVQATLEVKLEPSIARTYGREALGMVQQAGGTLIESRISGTDVGARIQQGARTIAQLEADLRRIEGLLTARGTSETERARLRSEAESIRGRIRALQETSQDQQETLANTPMTFQYGSGGFGSTRPDFARGLSEAWDGLLWAAYGLMVLLVVLLPWILLALLAWIAVRYLLRRLRRDRPAAPLPPEGGFGLEPGAGRSV
jgi:hypothetical protein